MKIIPTNGRGRLAGAWLDAEPIEERARVREQLELQPEAGADRAVLAEVLGAEIAVRGSVLAVSGPSPPPRGGKDMEPTGPGRGNAGIGAQRASATYDTLLPALRRREAFTRAHPDIDIRAKRENGRLRFYVTEPGRPEPAAWSDVNAMLDDLEQRHRS